MARGVPLVRQLDLRLVLLALAPIAILALGGMLLLWPERSLLHVALVWTYAIVALTARRRILRDHRLGLRSVRRGAWDEAISHFRSSYEFFSRRPALDRHRWLFLSANAMHLTEMALLNVAFCQAQAGRRAEAQATYERVLVEFPGSPLAVTTLNLMRDAPSPPAADPAS